MRGLLNVQFALAGDVLYVLEANPRASAHRAVRLEGDRGAAGQGGGAGHARRERSPSCAPRACCRRGDGADLPLDAPIAVKEAVLPFGTGSPGVDTVLGPEMKSTGEVMGIDAGFGTAFAKSQAAAYGVAADQGPGLRLVANRDKRRHDLPGQAAGRPRLRGPRHRGHRARCCAATASHATVVRKHFEGRGPTASRRSSSGSWPVEVDLIVNTPFGIRRPRLDGYEIRTAAVTAGIPCLTTVQARRPRRYRASRRFAVGDVGVASAAGASCRV